MGVVERKLDGEVFWVVLNRPEKLNALNLEGWRGLKAAMEEAWSSRAKAVVVTGSGRAFSTGDDIYMMAEAESIEENITIFREVKSVIERFLTLDKPIIAAVNGLAYGGGFELVLLCDLAVASKDAKFALPECGIGAYPPVASALLPILVPRKIAMELMLTRKELTAEEAHRLGLVNRVVPGERLLEEARSLAMEVASVPTASLRAVKKMAAALLWQLNLPSTVDELISLSQTREYRTAVKAFTERRRK